MNRSEKQKRLVSLAYKNLGKPYKYGAKPSEAPKSFDCSSFVQYLYKKIGVRLPRTALKQAHEGKEIKAKLENLETGDLIFIKGKWGHYDPTFPKGIGHVAIYVGDKKLINAKWISKNDGGKVLEEDVQDYFNRKDLIVIKRII